MAIKMQSFCFIVQLFFVMIPIKSLLSSISIALDKKIVSLDCTAESVSDTFFFFQFKCYNSFASSDSMKSQT